MVLWIFYKPKRFSILIKFISYLLKEMALLPYLAHGQKLMDPSTLLDQEVGMKLIEEANKEVELLSV